MLLVQVVVFIAPVLLGGYRSLTRQIKTPIRLQQLTVGTVGGDVVLHGTLKRQEMLETVKKSDAVADNDETMTAYKNDRSSDGLQSDQ